MSVWISFGNHGRGYFGVEARNLNEARADAMDVYLRGTSIGTSISIYPTMDSERPYGYVEHVGPNQFIWYDRVRRKKHRLNPDGTIRRS